MQESRDEESDDGSKRPAQMAPRGTIDMPPEEVVNGDVPLARELQPVAAIPPIGVEVAVGEARDLGEGAEDVLEDDEEGEEEGHHEGEEEARYRFREDEGPLRVDWRCGHAGCRVGEHGEDELLRSQC